MQLNTADKVALQIGKMRTAEQPRARQRKILNDFFNGEAPWTKKEAEDNHVLINFNDKQGTNLLRQARNQYENAFSKRDTFFKVTLPDCKDDLADEYGDTITREINRIIKGSKEYYYTLDEVWGGVCLHGPGMRVWDYMSQSWRPRFAGIQDVLIPTDTHLNMENLQCFAVRRRMRTGELYKKTVKKGKNRLPGWNMKAVHALLDEFKDLNENPNNYNWTDNPERMSEIWKQSSGAYDVGDISPSIDTWDFYHRKEGDDEKQPGWYLKVMLDKDCVAASSTNEANPREFIFESKGPVAPDLSQIIHFQFGDGNNVPPFMYHSIRSLAYLTYDLVWTMNRLNCQFTQHIFEQLMTMVRVQDPADRGRLNKVVLTPPFCIIPEGLNLVAGNERYKADYNLIETCQSQYRQRIGELTSAYTQRLDEGPSSEARTKFEVQALLAQTSALMASMLGRAYCQEHWACVEIARRFTIPDTHDFDAKKFQNACIKEGVPRKYLNSSLWQIEVEQVLGNGNRAMELAEASELFSNLGAFDPAAQMEIKKDWVQAVTNNPKKAARLAPLDGKLKPSESIADAEAKFATLWLGSPLNPPDGLNHGEQVAVLLGLMQAKLQQILGGKPPTEDDLRGFAGVADYVAKSIRLLSANEKLAETAKAATQQLTQIMTMVQKLRSVVEQGSENGNGAAEAEAMAKVEGMRAMTAAKIEGQQMSAAVKAQNSQASTQLKLQQKEQAHQQKLAQSEQSHQLSEALKTLSTQNDEFLKRLQAQNDIAIARLEAALKPKPETAKSRSE